MDLRTLAEECCGNLSVSARSRHLTLTCKGDSAILSGDRDLLKELMENLIQNAIQYNRENGSILVRTARRIIILSSLSRIQA